MTLRQRARTAVGLLAGLALIALTVADATHRSVTLTLQHKALLIGLVSAGLGLDIALDQLGVTLVAGPQQGQDSTGQRGADDDQ